MTAAPQHSARSSEGMVATSQPLAVQAGLAALEEGGTAADAAVTAAGVLCVVDPRSTGIGGDLIALHWSEGASQPEGLAAAGPAPAAMTPEALRAAGFDEMPALGPWTITVPGAVAGWRALLERCGRRGMERALAPAIATAEEGFDVTPRIAEEWATARWRIEHDETSSALLLPNGRPPRVGERFANPQLAKVLREIAAGGADAFYRGRLGEAIAAAVERAGGPLRATDLAEWAGPSWVEPLRRSFRGVDVFELPPPGQGVMVLEALGIFEGIEWDGRAGEEHSAIESLKLAFADASQFVADPGFEEIPTERLLSSKHLRWRRGEVNPRVARGTVTEGASDTVYVATADRNGAACSLIQSLYEGFGSGVGVPGAGIVLQNRGAGFTLSEGHPNRPAPGKRPYHTIIPAMLGRGGEFTGCLGVVGGFMQPQGQVQILRHLFDHELNPQQAVEMPRWRFWGERRIGLERDYDAKVARELKQRGHELSELDRFSAGGAQLILAEDGVLVGGSDPRKDGLALGVR